MDNKKKILCINIIKHNKCNYGNNCDYAHSYQDQQIDMLRKHAYDIIQNEFDLSYLDFRTPVNNELYKILVIMTKVCNDCISKKCPGGVNCKHGVYDKSLQICFDDMYNGNCRRENCEKIHLTLRNFHPINCVDMKKKKSLNLIPKARELNEDFFVSYYYNQYILNNNNF